MQTNSEVRMQNLVYRDPTDKLHFSDVSAYERAVKFPYADHEPPTVTKARREIETWFAVIARFNHCGIAHHTPAVIKYAYDLWLNINSESK